MQKYKDLFNQEEAKKRLSPSTIQKVISFLLEGYSKQYAGALAGLNSREIRLLHFIPEIQKILRDRRIKFEAERTFEHVTRGSKKATVEIPRKNAAPTKGPKPKPIKSKLGAISKHSPVYARLAKKLEEK